MDNFKHLNMVFTYVNYLKSWECELTTDRQHRIKFYGYASSARGAMDEAVTEYENAPEAVRKAL